MGLLKIGEALEALVRLYELDLRTRGVVKGKLPNRGGDQSEVIYGTEAPNPVVKSLYYERDGRDVESLPGPLDPDGNEWGV